MGYILIKIEGEEGRGVGKVYGKKINKDPMLLEAAVFVSGLREIGKILKKRKGAQSKEGKEEENRIDKTKYKKGRKCIIRIYAEYTTKLTLRERERWKQYGAPSKPVPQQGSVNNILEEILVDEKVEAMGLLPKIESKKKNK